jgi:glycosyltransferase involved in cell wall biosynthesis
LRYKNTPTLLKAVRELRELHTSGNDLWLLRAGGAFFPDEEDLIAELGIRERVVHAGRIPDDAGLAAYYRASDVLAFPSLYEGFGWPPLEAMACGTPVVTSNAASLPEVVGDAGLTVPPTDVSALAHALYTALTDEALRRTLRAKGMAQSALFTWENCAKNTLAVYRRIGENTV